MNILTTQLPNLIRSCVNSPLGDLMVMFSNIAGKEFIHSVDYIGNCNHALDCIDKLPNVWSQQFFAYFAGDLDALHKLPIRLLTGTEFQQDVWLALRDIPAGNTWSYKDIALHIKRPKAVRAVGQALSKNPLPIVLPCHRVIKSSGKLGGYAGNSEIGSMRKRYLLWHEGQLDADPQDLF